VRQRRNGWGTRLLAPDAQLDGVDGVVAAVVVGDDEDAVGFAGGDLKVGGVDAGVESVGLSLEAVLVGGLRISLRFGLRLGL
jgi:hypothetical protein